MGKRSNNSSSSVTVGYSYYQSFHMGICGTPIDELVQIRIGEKEAWKGSLAGTGEIKIDVPELFGGKSGEGGVQGEATLLMGNPDQTLPRKVKDMYKSGDLITAFRGLCTFFFDGLYSQMNPYPKPWTFRVRRATNGWDRGGAWYPERAVIWMGDASTGNPLDRIRAMNPAHIIYEAMSNREWGRGLDPTVFFDTASFRAAADTLYAEGFGLCYPWRMESSIGDFVQSIIDTIGAALFADRGTGLLTLKLIREDYNPDELPEYTVDNGVLSIGRAEVASHPATLNQVIVKFMNVVRDGEGQVRAQNLGSIVAMDAIYSKTTEYPGIPTPGLAQQVAERDLRSGSMPLRKFEITFDRRGWRLQPASVFKLRDDRRGIGGLVLRVVTFKEESIENGQVTVECAQDVFGFKLTSYTKPQPPAFEPEDTTPKIGPRVIFEMPYTTICANSSRADFEQVRFDDGYLTTAMAKPSPATNGYRIHSKFVSEPDTSYAERGSASFAPYATLGADVSYLTVRFPMASVSGVEEVTPGQVLYLPPFGGKAEEMVIVREIAGSDVIVYRGAVDTVPHEHVPGTPLWFYERDFGTDGREYVGAEEINVKLQPWSFSGSYTLAAVPQDYLLFWWRFIRPYAPGQMRINGRRWYRGDIIGPDHAAFFSWAHRHRVSQQDRLVHHNVGQVGPEPTQTYRLRFFNGSGTLMREEFTPHNYFRYPFETAAADLGITEGSSRIIVNVGSYREKMDSWQSYNIELRIDFDNTEGSGPDVGDPADPDNPNNPEDPDNPGGDDDTDPDNPGGADPNFPDDPENPGGKGPGGNPIDPNFPDGHPEDTPSQPDQPSPPPPPPPENPNGGKPPQPPADTPVGWSYGWNYNWDSEDRE